MHWILLPAGAVIANSAPHLAAGLQGRPFPSPFAKPPGRGDSSAIVNTIWGLANLIGGLVLLCLANGQPGLNLDGALLIGAVAITSVLTSIHFGRVYRERS